MASVKCRGSDSSSSRVFGSKKLRQGTPVTGQISFLEVHDILAISVKRPRAASSVGRARRSQRRGRGFESHAVHKPPRKLLKPTCWQHSMSRFLAARFRRWLKLGYWSAPDVESVRHKRKLSRR